MPHIDSILKVTTQKAFIKSFQGFGFENKWLGFGRMSWTEANNINWTTRYRTTERQPRFFATVITAPEFNKPRNFWEGDVNTDVYIQLYRYENFPPISEGLIIAIEKDFVSENNTWLDVSLSRLKELIPNSTITKIVRSWKPWFRFDNEIQDMNPHEIRSIVNGTIK